MSRDEGRSNRDERPSTRDAGIASREERRRLAAWDRRHVWHPFTPHALYADEDPVLVVAAEGHTLIDADGRRLLDGVSSLWCNLLGHRRPEIDAAIREQLGARDTAREHL